MTNTFSIAVSKALKKIGVEEWTGERFSTLDDCGMETEPMLPKYTLHDILRLMPKIGGKMGWDEGRETSEEITRKSSEDREVLRGSGGAGNDRLEMVQ